MENTENLQTNEELFEERVKNASENIKEVIQEVHKKIVGQEDLIESILIGLFAKGHILIEGVPGLAKTLTVDTVSKTLGLGFNRVQFTPDLLPSDLVGTEIYNKKTGDFIIKKGPIFNNFILADEINRAPSKVQSALLEAMAEKHITIGNDTFMLDKPFIVLATQNPIEHSGTYRLPEAQLDRFMLKINVEYPSKYEEIEMYKKLNNKFDEVLINEVLNKKDIIKIQDVLEEIHVSDNIYEYVSDIINSTREPHKYGLKNLEKYLNYGISPRGGLALISGAKVLALMNSRTYVIPEDIKKIAKKVIGHRLVLNYEAIADDVNIDDIIDNIMGGVKVV